MTMDDPRVEAEVLRRIEAFKKEQTDLKNAVKDLLTSTGLMREDDPDLDSMAGYWTGYLTNFLRGKK